MYLTWPNQIMNCTLSDANAFVGKAAAAGFAGGKLAIDPQQTFPGEVDGMIAVDGNGQPTGAPSPGFPSGNYRAAFCIQFPSQGDATRWINIGCAMAEIATGTPIAEVLAVPTDETGAIGGAQ